MLLARCLAGVREKDKRQTALTCLLSACPTSYHRPYVLLTSSTPPNTHTHTHTHTESCSLPPCYRSGPELNLSLAFYVTHRCNSLLRYAHCLCIVPAVTLVTVSCLVCEGDLDKKLHRKTAFSNMRSSVSVDRFPNALLTSRRNPLQNSHLKEIKLGCYLHSLGLFLTALIIWRTVGIIISAH